jgi:hypothetical protein
MGGKRGRPPMLAKGVWRHQEVLERRVCTIIRRRDPENEESITEAVYGVRALARRVVSATDLTRERIRYLYHLAVEAEPSDIVRVLLGWRFRLPDRAVRRLQARTDIAEIRWA